MSRRIPQRLALWAAALATCAAFSTQASVLLSVADTIRLEGDFNFAVKK